MPIPVPQRWSTTVAATPHHRLALALSSLTVLEVSGEHAHAFLQGQLSNDVAAIAPAQSQLSAYCNPKGRVLAVLRLVRHAHGFYMLVPTALAEPLVKRLKMFVLRAKVDIAPSPQTALLGVINWQADDEPRNANNDASDSNDHTAAMLRIPIHGIFPRQLLLGEASAIETWLSAHPHTRQPHDEAWRFIDIRSGIPQVYPQTVEQFIPQMINLDWIDGLSFTKGCYPGQEIVARLRYLGKLKQRMIIGSVHSATSIVPGEPIYLLPADSDPTSQQPTPQKCGLVVDVVETAEGEYTLSATAPTNLLANDELRLGCASGPAVTRIPLPYAEQATSQQLADPKDR